MDPATRCSAQRASRSPFSTSVYEQFEPEPGSWWIQQRGALRRVPGRGVAMPGRAWQHTRVIIEAVPHRQCKELDQPMSGMCQAYIEGYRLQCRLPLPHLLVDETPISCAVRPPPPLLAATPRCHRASPATSHAASGHHSRRRPPLPQPSASPATTPAAVRHPRRRPPSPLPPATAPSACYCHRPWPPPPVSLTTHN